MSIREHNSQKVKKLCEAQTNPTRSSLLDSIPDLEDVMDEAEALSESLVSVEELLGKSIPNLEGDAKASARRCRQLLVKLDKDISSFIVEISKAVKFVDPFAEGIVTENEKEDFIITKGNEFWTGNSWNDEYPEAKKFKKLSDAEKEKKLKLKNQGDIVQSYGYEDEQVVG
jgi:hypothetical protein